MLGGWRTTWTVVTQSGQYCVPDRIDDGNLSSERSAAHWFDSTAFAIPGCPATTPVCSKPDNVGRFGNSGFNILALNHPNFSNPAANISATNTVGTITGQTRPLLAEPGPREIDFGLRLDF